MSYQERYEALKQNLLEHYSIANNKKSIESNFSTITINGFLSNSETIQLNLSPQNELSLVIYQLEFAESSHHSKDDAYYKMAYYELLFACMKFDDNYNLAKKRKNQELKISIDIISGLENKDELQFAIIYANAKLILSDAVFNDIFSHFIKDKRNESINKAIWRAILLVYALVYLNEDELADDQQDIATAILLAYFEKLSSITVSEINACKKIKHPDDHYFLEKMIATTNGSMATEPNFTAELIEQGGGSIQDILNRFELDHSNNVAVAYKKPICQSEEIQVCNGKPSNEYDTKIQPLIHIFKTEALHFHEQINNTAKDIQLNAFIKDIIAYEQELRLLEAEIKYYSELKVKNDVNLTPKMPNEFKRNVITRCYNLRIRSIKLHHDATNLFGEGMIGSSGWRLFGIVLMVIAIVALLLTGLIVPMLLPLTTSAAIAIGVGIGTTVALTASGGAICFFKNRDTGPPKVKAAVENLLTHCQKQNEKLCDKFPESKRSFK